MRALFGSSLPFRGLSIRACLLPLFFFLGAALPMQGATAAPQMLGVIASSGVLPLQCADGECSAELSSFCLQRERPVPRQGTRYSLANAETATLVLTRTDGTTQRMSAAGHLRFASARNYTSVKVSLAAGELALLGAVSAAVEIGEGTALVPHPQAGDPRPQTESDVELAMMARRGAGTHVVDHDGKASAARVLNIVVNTLSPQNHAGVTPRESLWRDSLAQGKTSMSQPGMKRAAELYHACHATTLHDSDATLRWCLQLRHDALIMELNGDYWDAVKTGS